MTDEDTRVFDDDWVDNEAVETGAISAGKAFLLYKLMEASEAGSGELVISDGDERAKVHFHDGKIAWVVRTDQPHGFVDHLIRLGLGERQELTDLLARCGRDKRPFTEALSESGMLGPEAVRLALRDFLTRSLGDVLQWAEPEAVFSPWHRAFDGQNLFAPRELVQSAIEECFDEEDDPNESGVRRVDADVTSCLDK